MGFFDDLKKEISQAVTELVSDEELLKEEDDYDTGVNRTISQPAKSDDIEYFDEDDYIETEDDYREDEPQSMGVVVDDLASDEYVNSMKIDIKDLIASYSNELNQNAGTEPLEENSEEQYGGGYGNEYDNQYVSAQQTAGEQYAGVLPEEEEAPQAMEAMSALGFSDELAQMYGDDDDVMVNTLDDDVFGVDTPQDTEPESIAEEVLPEEPETEAMLEPEPMIQEALPEEPEPELAIQEALPEEPEPATAEMLPEEQKELPEPEPTAADILSAEPITETPEEINKQAEDNWITEELLPDDFDEKLPVTQEIVSKEPIMADEPQIKETPSKKKVTRKPAAKKTKTEEPAAIEPEIEKPVAIEPEAEKPVVIEQEIEEPVVIEQEIEEPVVIEPETKKPAVKKKAEKEPAVMPDMIVKKQPEEKTVKKEVNEEQEELLMPTFEEDTPNTRDILEDMADYSDETTVITKGVVVKGDIISGGSINVLGEVEGNLTCKGKLMVSGTIHGNAEAGELFANDAHITGNIVNAGSVKIGQGSIIIGNVTGSSAVIAGAIKGDIDVKGPVVVDSTAIIMGDIKSKSVQINNGAAIEGRCSQCYADVNPTSFFKEN